MMQGRVTSSHRDPIDILHAVVCMPISRAATQIPLSDTPSRVIPISCRKYSIG